MALTTHAKVTIAATAAQVFAWLVEPAKLTVWLGSAGGMPEDTSQLHTGWTSSSRRSPSQRQVVDLRTCIGGMIDGP